MAKQNAIYSMYDSHYSLDCIERFDEVKLPKNLWNNPYLDYIELFPNISTTIDTHRSYSSILVFLNLWIRCFIELWDLVYFTVKFYR